MESYVIFLIGFGLICAIVSHCVRVGKDSNAKSNNTDNTSEKEKADMAYNKAISDFAKSNDAKAGENSDFMAELKSVAKTPEEVDMIKKRRDNRRRIRCQRYAYPNKKGYYDKSEKCKI